VTFPNCADRGGPALPAFILLQSSDLGFGQIPNEFTVTWDGSAISIK